MRLVVGNFKLNLLQSDVNNYLKSIEGMKLDNVVFCPSYLYLNDFIKKGFTVGSQDVSFKPSGALTGDVSAIQLSDLGVRYAIVGHSERREAYQDGIYVNRKLALCLENNLVPILCIGETLEEFNNSETNVVLERELDEAFHGVDSNLLKNVVVAYEPIWSIGTGRVPSNETIFKVVDYIKRYVNLKYGVNVRVLYGGSLNKDNINTINKICNIDGYLVGGASIKVHDFLEIINNRGI